MFGVIIHGGESKKRPTATQREILRKTLEFGFCELRNGKAALDVSVAVVSKMEMSGKFNAGRGAYAQEDKVQRLDASVMDGSSLKAGAIAGPKGFSNAVHVARAVMDHTDHVLLTGQGAQDFARSLPKNTFETRELDDSRKSTPVISKDCDTVGCVALDKQGHLAAAASTGGIKRMKVGRVGDTPQIGSGIYADDSICAICATGEGESITRAVLYEHRRTGIPRVFTQGSNSRCYFGDEFTDRRARGHCVFG